jgi:hypothetical protein
LARARSRVTRMTEQISRRTMFGVAGTAATVLGSALLAASSGARADASQLQKQDVRYQDQPKGAQRCSGCANFTAPSACKVVAGNVNPNGWCLLYTATKQ